MLAYSLFDNTFDRTPKRQTASWVELVQLLTKHRTTQSKESVGLWSPASFDGVRSKRAVTSIGCMVLDIDHVSQDDWRLAIDTAKGWDFIAYSSFSHGLDDTVSGRLVFRVPRPLSVDEHRRCWRWLYTRFPMADRACRDASRIYYLPSTAAERLSKAFGWSECPGVALPLDEALREDPRASNRAVRPEAPTDGLLEAAAAVGLALHEGSDCWVVSGPCPACLSSDVAAPGAEPGTGYILPDGTLRCQREKCPAHFPGWPLGRWSAPPAPEPSSLDDAVRQLREAIEGFRTETNGYAHVIAVPPGTGKTHEIVDTIRNAKRPGSFVLAHRTHALLEQSARLLDMEHRKTVPLSDPRCVGDRDAIKAYSEAGYSPRRWVCSGCPEREDCVVYRGIEGKRGPLLTTHAALEKRAGTLPIGRQSLVVYDELPGSLAPYETRTIEELRRVRDEPAGRLRDWMMRTGCGESLDRLIEIAESQTAGSEEEVSVGVDYRGEYEEFPAPSSDQLDDWPRPLDRLLGAKVLVCEREVRLYQRWEPIKNRVLILDATAGQERLALNAVVPNCKLTELSVTEKDTTRLYKYAENVSRTRLAYELKNTTIGEIGMYGRFSSKMSVETPIKLIKEARQNAEKTMGFVRRVGIISYMSVIDGLARTDLGFEFVGRYYGDVRGYNDMSDVELLIVLGDPYPNIVEARREAEALGVDFNSYLDGKTQAEIVQAIGRARALRRKGVGLAYIGRLFPACWNGLTVERF